VAEPIHDNPEHLSRIREHLVTEEQLLGVFDHTSLEYRERHEGMELLGVTSGRIIDYKHWPNYGEEWNYCRSIPHRIILTTRIGTIPREEAVPRGLWPTLGEKLSYLTIVITTAGSMTFNFRIYDAHKARQAHDLIVAQLL
jgi:hypothetical protein